jgi:hypothetical protein
VSLASTFNAGRARTPGPGQASQTRPEPEHSVSRPEQQKKVALAHFGPARSFEPSSCGSGTAPLALSTATATATTTAARATRDSSHHQQPAKRTRHDWATPRARPCTSRHWNPPSHARQWSRRLVEAWNFPDNGGGRHRGLEMETGPESRDGGSATRLPLPVSRSQLTTQSSSSHRARASVYRPRSTSLVQLLGLKYRAEALESRAIISRG